MSNVVSYPRVRTVAGFTALGLFLSGILCLSLPAKDAVDSVASTPVAALAAFRKALEEGDAVVLSPLISGDAKEKAWIMAYAAQLRAFRDMEQALARRFGKDYTEGDTGKEIREQIETARDEDLHADLKRAKLEKPDGDTVLVIFDEAASDDRQGKLVRVDGKWKMELVSLSNFFSVDDTPGLRAMADAATSLARDVSAGKFKSIDDAAKAVQERLDDAQAVGAKTPADVPVAKPKRN